VPTEEDTMSNPLLELEKSLGSAGTRRRGTTKKRKAAKSRPVDAPETPPPPSPPIRTVASPRAATPVPAPPATSPAAATPALAKAASAVNYRIPGLLAPLKQPSGMTCWATVTTMMMQWRAQASMTIETAMGRIGAVYLTKFQNNQGLLGSEKVPFLTAAGLSYEHPQSRTAAGWEALLRNFGPLWVTTDENPGAGFSIHARILVCIRGDGSETGTTMEFVDPAQGNSYAEKFGTFLQKYEAEARDPKRALRIQIVHWPHDAGFAVSRALQSQSSAYALSLAAEQFATVDDAEFEPAYDEARPSVPRARAHSAFSAALDRTKRLTAAAIRWAPDAQSADYRHLGTPINTTPYELTPAVLDALVRLNRFPLDDVENKVVFGLRGCTLDGNVTSFTSKATLREIEPNHIDNRCVIVVWDRQKNSLVALQGSTVPNWEYMERYRQDRGKKANMLPGGRYLMSVGTHRPKKENAKGELVDNPKRVQGALRNDQRVVVLRSEDDLSFTTKDTWDETVPNDNIHAAIVSTNAGSSTTPDYSSAGCTTIPGTSVSDTPAGSWADFRVALGLDNVRLTKDDGRKFAYILLTGREARCVAAAPTSTALARLRFGSKSDEVRQLQEALARHAKQYYKGKADGELSAATSMAFIRYQKDRDAGAADGVVTPSDLTALGVSLAGVPAAKPASQLGIIEDIGRFIFRKVTQRPEEGRFTVKSDAADLLHEDSAAVARWSRTTTHLILKASTPDPKLKDVARGDVFAGGKTRKFKLRIEWLHNGFDIRDATVHRVLQGSSEFNDGKFEVEFSAQPATSLKTEHSQIDFIVKGKWDPGLGDKRFDFSGRLAVRSDGSADFTLDKTDRVAIEFQAGATFGEWKKVDQPAPKFLTHRHITYFKVNLAEPEDAELKRFKDWVASLRPKNPDDPTTREAIRFQRLSSGVIPITVDAYASGTGNTKLNEKLSDARLKRMIELLTKEFTDKAVFRKFSHGEPDPTDKKPVENKYQRVVEVSFQIPL
jgi:hypothetical protein